LQREAHAVEHLHRPEAARDGAKLDAQAHARLPCSFNDSCMASAPAPTSPAWPPSGVYWISRCRVDSASERWYTLWRTEARNSGPIWVTPPPMNTCEGLKKFTTEASIWPMRLPARWMMALAAASPLRLAWPTSTAVSLPLACR